MPNTKPIIPPIWVAKTAAVIWMDNNPLGRFFPAPLVVHTAHGDASVDDRDHGRPRGTQKVLEIGDYPQDDIEETQRIIHDIVIAAIGGRDWVSDSLFLGKVVLHSQP